VNFVASWAEAVGINKRWQHRQTRDHNSRITVVSLLYQWFEKVLNGFNTRTVPIHKKNQNFFCAIRNFLKSTAFKV